MIGEQKRWLGAAALAASVGLHLGAYSALGQARAAAQQLPGPAQVDFAVVAPALPADRPAEPAPDPLPGPQPAPAARLAPDPLPGPQPAPPPGSEPEQDTGPVDLTGTTLTNDGAGAGWSSMVGNGAPLQGPLRTPVARRDARPLVRASAQRQPSSRPPRPSRPSLVALSDLSRPPRPPELGPVLLQNYPDEARRRGLGGRATVRASIDPDGRVRAAAVTFETAPGFGAACRRTVLGSVWSAPLARNGQPVATQVGYTCRFQVHR